MIITVIPGPALLGDTLVIIGPVAKLKPVRVPVPPGPVTCRFPVEPVPTTAVIKLSVMTVKPVAATPPKVTPVAPVKFEPLIKTVAPCAALVGEKLVIFGGATKAKPPEVIVPPGAVTETLHVAPPLATTAVICVGEFTIKLAAGTPPKLTAVAPKKFVPVIVTVAPAAALVGAKPPIVGGAKKLKPALVPVPPGVVTETFPLAPPAATTAVICIADTTVKLAAGTPPTLTAVAPVKFAPLIVTVAPTAALVGVKLLIVGGKIKVKPGFIIVPPSAVTRTLPLAPAPTTASIWVGETTV